MPHFAQQYIPDNLGNEADRQIARLFDLEDCHTKTFTNDEAIIGGDTFVADTVASGHLVGGHHGVIDGSGDADCACSVLFLPLGEV